MTRVQSGYLQRFFFLLLVCFLIEEEAAKLGVDESSIGGGLASIRGGVVVLATFTGLALGLGLWLETVTRAM